MMRTTPTRERRPSLTDEHRASGKLSLRFTTFSRPKLTDGSGKPIVFSEKGLVTLAYLCTRKTNSASRTELAEFLWGDSEECNATGNLRQLLARIKARQEDGGFEVLNFHGAEVSLSPGGLSCDVNELPSDVSTDPMEATRKLVTVLTGEFLTGFAMSSQSGEFWLAAERSRHGALLARAVAAAMETDRAGADSETIREACLRLLSLDSFNTTAYRVLLRIYGETGQRGPARALFNRYQDRVRSEFGVAPEPELVQLMLELFPHGAAPSVRAEVVPEREADASRGVQHILPRLLILPPRQAPGHAAALAGALIEDVTIALCQARTVAIVAPHTARQIVRVPEPRSEVLARHHVSYEFETTLRQEGDDMLLFGALVEVRKEALIWAERFNVSAGNLSRSYRDMVRNLVVAVTTQIELHEFADITNASEPNAYQHYLLGQYHSRKLDLAHLRRARKMFRAALHVAPDFPNALSGLARTEHLEWLVTARGDDELLVSSERHARLAIAADPGSASGYHQLGVTRLYSSDFDESLSAFDEAEKRAPSHADLIADYADTLVHASEPELAVEKIEKAIDLNPYCPDVYWWTAAGANYCLGKFEPALECVEKMDDGSGATRLAAACWGMLGDTAKARGLMRKTMKIYPDFEIEKWLAIMPLKDDWHKEHYREGLRKAGFK
jgi:DNA-binding SARP family transcriptional activator/tetratricopeptide (TPR) repeat protein